MWVRGLKPGNAGATTTVAEPSHPVWVRGLKRRLPEGFKKPRVVAPRVGAWIETYKSITLGNSLFVAPRVGAWIETLFLRISHLHRIVAPRVGAWIETTILGSLALTGIVAPRVGAWIETSVWIAP